MILLILISLMSNLSNPVTKNGMTVGWEFVDNTHIKFKLQAPADGWIAIGLNPKNQLVGSNLIMVSVTKEEQIISDRYVVGFGDHKSMSQLGGRSAVNLSNASNQNNVTKVEFIIETEPKDKYHFTLKPGKKIHLTMAFSNSDDFMHHSAMRTSVEIIL